MVPLNEGLLNMEGPRTKIVPRYIEQLKDYIDSMDPNMPHFSFVRKEYMTYLNLLEYYRDISDMNGPYISSFLDYINEEYQYLQNTLKGHRFFLEPQGRVKSPYSADEKIREKILEIEKLYKANKISGIEAFERLDSIQDSIKDFVAFRYVLNFHDSLTTHPQKTVEEVYKLLAHQMEFEKLHGFDFLTVNPATMRMIKSPIEYDANPNLVGVYIPRIRPPEIEQYDGVLKDYIRYPKVNLYQSAQYAVIPPWGHYDPEKGYALPYEYQTRTILMHRFAEKGGASHTEYKKRDHTFNRLRVPFLFGIDYNSDSYEDRITDLSFDDCVKKFYGYSFADQFGIDYETLKKMFDEETQDRIIAGTWTIERDKEGNLTLNKEPSEHKVKVLAKVSSQNAMIDSRDSFSDDNIK